MYIYNILPACNGLFYSCKNRLDFCANICRPKSNIGLDKAPMLMSVSLCMKHYSSYSHVKDLYKFIQHITRQTNHLLP